MVNEHPEGKVCPLRMFQFMQDQGCIGDKCMWIWKCREPVRIPDDLFRIHATTKTFIPEIEDMTPDEFGDLIESCKEE